MTNWTASKKSSLAAKVPKLAEVRAEKAKRHLRDFIRQAWHVVEPVTAIRWNWHIDAISEHLEAVSRGQIRYLLINMPPRHMKSLAVAVFWPCWEWTTRPALRWLYSSYGMNLSIRDSLKCRRIIQSPWYQANWGHVFQLTGDQNAKVKFENDKTGYRIATSVEGVATGEGGDRIVVDDPHNLIEAESDAAREGVLRWWDQGMSTRMNDPRSTPKVIVMQRLHENDLSGHLLEKGDYEHLCLPAEFEPERKCFTSLGWEDPRAEDGELLWPEHVGPAEISVFKREMGSYGFAGQFQQRPAPAGGGLFKKEYFRYFTRHENIYTLQTGDNGGRQWPVSQCWKFATCDPAGTTKTSSDYFVVGAWAVTPHNDLLLFDLIRTKLEGPDQPNLIRQFQARWNLGHIGIEAKSMGLTLFQQLKRDGLPVRELKADADKFTRALPMAARYESGKVYHLADAPWLNDLEAELLRFPNATHDDQVDMAAYAGATLMETGGLTSQSIATSGKPSVINRSSGAFLT